MTLAGAITVLVTTSPIPSHPSTAIIEATLASLDAAGLGGCETLIACDGIRPEQEDRRADYGEYLRRLCWACSQRPNTLPIVFGEFRHQAGMTASALEQVRTPLVLFVEHDTPLCGEIPWASMVRAIDSGGVDVIRLGHEANVLDVHRYLVNGKRRDVRGVPLVRVAQWSSRPHLASADWYRKMLADYFPPHARTFIEDRIYSEIATPWVERKEWGGICQLWLYAPTEGTWKRSEHLDGRAGEEKYGMTW